MCLEFFIYFLFQRSGFINAEGLLLTDVLHSVARPMAEVEAPTASSPLMVAGPTAASTTSNSNSNSQSEEENKFKGSLLCVDRYGLI